MADAERGRGEAAPRTAALILVTATLASLALLWLVTQSPAMLGGFAAAALLLGALAFSWRRLGAGDEAAPGLPPDWTVTRAAADQALAGLAISDRAGRLVCANERFTMWFDGPRAPPDLPLDPGGRELLAEAGRAAWRDGAGFAEGVRRGVADYSVRVQRSGVADEYLVWMFDPAVQTSLASEAQRMVAGPAGRAMARAGLMAVAIGGEGRVRAANGAFARRATGRDEANIAGRDIAQLLSVDEKGAILFAHEGPRGVPLRLVHIPLEAEDMEGPALILALDEDGAMVDRKAALGHVEHLLSTLPLGLALADRDGRFLFVNDAFARVAGLSSERVPLYPGDMVVREDKAAVADTVRRYATGQPLSGDLAVRLKDAPDEVVALSVAGVRGLGDAAVLLSLKDNSEESRLKREVAQATKMQAVGQLAGGVAHDFNNILTAILGYCDLILLRHEPGDSDYDDIQQIKGNANRAASLTRQLLAFSRQQTLRPQVLQLPDIVSDTATLIKRLIGEKVRLEVSHGRGIGPVRADPGQLGQVVMNLSVNARDAMLAKDPVGGGTLGIATAAVSAAEVAAMNSDILPVGDYARLSVTDSGTGIPREHLGKIFEPFFTTKEVGKGTGLGLSTVYGIVKQSGGFIFADNVADKDGKDAGARFDLYLPVHRGDGASAPQLPREPKARETWGSGTILVVEDEDMVRAVAERALTRAGFKVETARDGELALELFEQGRSFDLVLTDVVMPNMDGPAMARAVRALKPDQPILFMSGYAEEQLRRDIDLDGVYFLPKPFTVQQIAAAAKDALDAAEAK